MENDFDWLNEGLGFNFIFLKFHLTVAVKKSAQATAVQFYWTVAMKFQFVCILRYIVKSLPRPNVS